MTVHGDALASQPTLSRFQNGFGRGELLAMSEALLETVLARRKPRKVKRITNSRLKTRPDPQRVVLMNRSG